MALVALLDTGAILILVFLRVWRNLESTQSQVAKLLPSLVVKMPDVLVL